MAHRKTMMVAAQATEQYPAPAHNPKLWASRRSRSLYQPFGSMPYFASDISLLLSFRFRRNYPSGVVCDKVIVGSPKKRRSFLTVSSDHVFITAETE